MFFLIHKLATFCVPIVYLVFFCIFILAFTDFTQIFIGSQYETISIYGTTFDQFKNKKLIIFIFIAIYIVCMLIMVFSNRSIIHFLGCTDIRTLDYGEYAYCVYATSEKGKTQKMLAKICVDYDDKDDDTSQMIWIENIYFNNGGYLYFEDSDVFCPYSKENPSYIINKDQNGKYWEIELTNQKVYTTKFDDWPLYDRKEIIWFVTGVVILSIVMSINIYYYAKYQIIEKLKNNIR